MMWASCFGKRCHIVRQGKEDYQSWKDLSGAEPLSPSQEFPIESHIDTNYLLQYVDQLKPGFWQIIYIINHSWEGQK